MAQDVSHCSWPGCQQAAASVRASTVPGAPAPGLLKATCRTSLGHLSSSLLHFTKQGWGGK